MLSWNPFARLRPHDLWPASWYLRAFLLVGVVETIGNVTIGMSRMLVMAANLILMLSC